MRERVRMRPGPIGVLNVVMQPTHLCLTPNTLNMISNLYRNRNRRFCGNVLNIISNLTCLVEIDRTITEWDTCSARYNNVRMSSTINGNVAVDILICSTFKRSLLVSFTIVLRTDNDFIKHSPTTWQKLVLHQTDK